MQKTRCIPGAETNIVLSSVWISKIVFYSNGFDWDYRQYQAPSWREELCNWNIYWLREGFLILLTMKFRSENYIVMVFGDMQICSSGHTWQIDASLLLPTEYDLI